MNFKHLQPYAVVFSASLFFLFEFVNMNSFNALNDELRAAFNVNALQISNLSAMYFYANVLFLIPAGILLDRISTKILLQAALFLCILSNIVFAHTHNFHVAEACRFVTGMGSTLCLLSCALLTSRWFPCRQAGLIMGLVVTMAMLGGMLAQQLTFVLYWLGSWRSSLFAVAGLGILFLLIITLVVKDYPPEYASRFKTGERLLKGHFWQNAQYVLKNRQIWLAGLYTSLINLTVMLVGALWGKDYLMKAHSLTELQASSVISMVFLGLIVGCPLFGFLSDSVRRRKTPMILGGTLNILCVLLILYTSFSLHMALFIFFILGVLSSSQILTYPLIMESTPSHLVASSESLSATLIMGGGALFQPLFGYVLTYFAINGTYTLAAYQHAMLILPLAFLAATLLAFFLKETYCKEFI
jgi:MFS family permease